jgi:hypothetical protein
MDIPTELSGILSEFGLPVTAGALAWVLVKGADALKEDAKEERLRYISDLLKDHSFISYGKLGASIVPFVFNKVFGSNPISVKFVFRSILASIIFWIILMTVKHTNIISVLSHPTNLSLMVLGGSDTWLVPLGWRFSLPQY